MSHQFRIWLCAVLFICGLAGAAREHAASSPQECVAAVLKAMESGDAEAIATLVDGDEAQRAWMAAQAAQLGATRTLRGALEERFSKAMKSEDGEAVAARITQAADAELHDDLAKAKPRALGADAVLLVVDERRGDELQPHVVRVDGQWKLEMSSLVDYFAPQDTPVMRAVAKACELLARQVLEGKFATLPEAAEAIEQRLSAAEEPPAATRPNEQTPAAHPLRNHKPT